MGKPKAPAPPDYAAAATAQGQANVNSALASNYLNQINQVTPYGNLTYSYSQNGQGGKTLPDGTYIPETTVTTTLSPDQQKLLDQQTSMGLQLNDLASKGIGYVSDASSKPIDQSALPSMATGLALAPDATKLRDTITNAYMQRLQPMLDRQKEAMDNSLAIKGINAGSEAWAADQDSYNRGLNDQRIAALLAGDQEQQNIFNRGLASAQFQNQARQQAIQEADYFKNQPLNMLNALRSGNQVQMPQFGNWSGGAQIAAAPIYQATADQYTSALDSYKARMAAQGGLLGGLGQLGAAAITKFSDRRLKRFIRKLGELADGLGVYAYRYIWDEAEETGVMADEVAKLRPWALGPQVAGFQTVNYGAL